jgi:hypothetical protein
MTNSSYRVEVDEPRLTVYLARGVLWLSSGEPSIAGLKATGPQPELVLAYTQRMKFVFRLVLVHRVLLMSGLSIGLMGMVRFHSEIVVSTKIISLDIRNSEVSTKNGWLTEGSSVILDNVEKVSSNFDYPNQSIRVFPGFLGDEGISLVALRAFDVGAFGL